VTKFKSIVTLPYILLFVLPVILAYLISNWLGIFMVGYKGHYGEAELLQAKETLLIIVITAFITGVFAILAAYFRNLLKFFLLFYFAISLLAGIILVALFFSSPGLGPGPSFIAPIVIVLSQIPNFIMIYLLRKNTQRAVGILSVCYSMILIFIPSILYLYSSKTLPSISERNFRNDLKNLGINIFEPSYLPEGFTQRRSDISGSQFSSTYCHYEKISNSNNLPCFRLIQEGRTYSYYQYEDVGEPVFINNSEGFIYKDAISTHIVWRQENTTIELWIDKDAQSKISSDEAIKIAESTTRKIN